MLDFLKSQFGRLLQTQKKNQFQNKHDFLSKQREDFLAPFTFHFLQNQYHKHKLFIFWTKMFQYNVNQRLEILRIQTPCDGTSLVYSLQQ